MTSQLAINTTIRLFDAEIIAKSVPVYESNGSLADSFYFERIFHNVFASN